MRRPGQKSRHQRVTAVMSADFGADMQNSRWGDKVDDAIRGPGSSVKEELSQKSAIKNEMCQWGRKGPKS
jgi:hypothetical protein